MSSNETTTLEKTFQEIREMGSPLPSDLRVEIGSNVATQFREMINDEEKITLWQTAAYSILERAAKTHDLWVEKNFRKYFFEYIYSVWPDEFTLALQKQALPTDKKNRYNVEKNDFQNFFQDVATESLWQIVTYYRQSYPIDEALSTNDDAPS